MCRVAPLPQEIAVVLLAAAQIVWNSRKTSSTQINMKNEKFDKTAKFHLIINHLKNRLQYQFSPFRITDCKQFSLLVFRMQLLLYKSDPSKVILHMYSAFSIRSCASYMCNSKITYHVIKNIFLQFNNGVNVNEVEYCEIFTYQPNIVNTWFDVQIWMWIKKCCNMKSIIDLCSVDVIILVTKQ